MCKKNVATARLNVVNVIKMLQLQEKIGIIEIIAVVKNYATVNMISIKYYKCKKDNTMPVNFCKKVLQSKEKFCNLQGSWTIML